MVYDGIEECANFLIGYSNERTGAMLDLLENGLDQSETFSLAATKLQFFRTKLYTVFLLFANELGTCEGGVG